MKLDLFINNKKIENYRNYIYDQCENFDKDFDLKYGNSIISYKNPPNIFIVNNYRMEINKNEGSEKYFLSVCITTMYNYNAKLMFNQLINIYLNLGVDHFTIYYSSSSKDILNIIEKYKKRKIIELIYWKRDNNSIRMRNYGQYIKTNDCLYRYLNKASYLINTDLDEVLLPIKFYNLRLYINYVLTLKPNTTMILFSSKMFVKNESTDMEIKMKKKHYTNLHKITDVNLFSIVKCCYSNQYYKKFIVHVKDMIAIQIHKVWKGNINIYNVPYREGYSRHTRRVVYFLKRSYCKNMEYDYNLSLMLPNLSRNYM